MKLLDAVAQHTRHPDTFEIPSAHARSSLRPGDMAKLVILDPHGGGGSREWADVTRVVSPGVYEGDLIEEARPTPVRFTARHVIDAASGSDVQKGRLVGTAFKAAMLGAIAYGVYRLVRR